MSEAKSPSIIEVYGESPYTVTVGEGVVDGVSSAVLGASQVCVIHQGSVAEYAGSIASACERSGITVHRVEVPDGETAKTVNTLATLWDVLGDKGFTRSDAIIGVGGGAATDLAGFTAATWLRGVRVVQVPTTVLAMVDGSVGGKTAINTAAGKNLVGAFHPPAAVFCDTSVLSTLSVAEIRSGIAEVVKVGLCRNPSILPLCTPTTALDPQAPGFRTLLTLAIEAKATVVGQDLKESGLREVLNYGHTLGHALELAEDFSLRHGEAVSIGMVFVAELASRLGLLAPHVVHIHRTVLSRLGLPLHYSGNASWESLRQIMSRDKKARGASLRFVALTAIGSTTIIDSPPENVLRQAFQAIQGEQS